MTIEQRLAELERKYEDLRLVQDVVFTESLKKRTLQGVINTGIKSTASTSDMNENVAAVPATVAKAFDAKVRVQIDGSSYYIGLQDA